MKRLFVLMLFVLILTSFASAYGVTFYSPTKNPQYGKIFQLAEPDTGYVVEDTKDRDVAINRVTFTIDREAKSAGITIYHLQALPELPDFPEDDTYEVDELKYSGFVPHDTTSVVYEFKVRKIWLENQSVPRNSIVLHAYNKKTNFWDVLPTKIIDEDDVFVFFKAEAVGYHHLLIGKAQGDSAAESMIATGVEEVEKTEEKTESTSTPALTKEEVDISTDVTAVTLGEPVATAAPTPPAPQPTSSAAPATDVVEPEEGESKTLSALSLIAIAVLIVVLYVIFGKKKVLGSSVDRELSKYIKESIKRGKSKEEVKSRLLEVGWHHDRIEKALSKFKTEVKSSTKTESVRQAKPAPKKAKKAAGAKKK